MVEVRRLAAEGRLDALLIESTGIAEPMPIAATFDFRDAQGRSLSDLARLDTMVTVVDAASFLRDYPSAESLASRGQTAGAGDTRLLVDLLVEQVAFADVLVVNKTDLVTDGERERLIAILRTFTPEARIVTASHGRVPLATVLDTGLFDFEKAARAAGWSKALDGDHLPESEAYGIRCFVYRAHRPFHPARFHRVLTSDLPGVIRAKRFFWLATRLDWAGAWQLAGSVGRHEAAGLWWAAVPRERWRDDPAWRRGVRALWREPYGDRRQEIVFIGQHMDEAAIRRDLDRALLTEAEFAMGPKAWARLPDPFPAWRREAA